MNRSYGAEIKTCFQGFLYFILTINVQKNKCCDFHFELEFLSLEQVRVRNVTFILVCPSNRCNLQVQTFKICTEEVTR